MATNFTTTNILKTDREKLKQLATQEGRSMAQEIHHILENYKIKS